MTLDLGLGDTVMRYIDGGRAAKPRAAPAIA